VAAGPAPDALADSADRTPAEPATDGPAGAEIVGFVPAGPAGVPVPIFAAEEHDLATEREAEPPGAPAAANGTAPARRARGLDAPFAPGGQDEATEARRKREGRDLRLLIFMVAALVGIPTVLTFVALIADLLARRGGG
jgi:hypothetical protein